MADKNHIFLQSFLLLPIFLNLIPLSFFHHSYNHEKNQEHPGSKNYIVRFLGYKHASDHRAYLDESKVGLLKGWKWMERSNAASKFPTDFGVVEVEDGWREVVIGELEGLELVKDVTRDSTINRGFLAFGEDIFEGKKPGKLFTKMSFGPEEEDVGGGTVAGNWSRVERKLMMDVCYFFFCFVFKFCESFDLYLIQVVAFSSVW